MFHRLKRTFCWDAIVQFDNNNRTVCGDSVKFIQQVYVSAFTRKTAIKLAFETLDEKYPKYKGYIQLL